MFLTSNKFIKILFITLLGLLTFITVLLLRSFQPERDALQYAYWAEIGFFFHPHHLLYSATIHLFYLILNPIIQCNALFVAQVHSALWASISVVSIFIIVRSLIHSTLAALVASVLTLFTNAFWIWSTQSESYIPMTGTILLLSAILLTYGSQERMNKTQMAICSGILSLSIFFHQISVLFCIPLIYYLVAVKKKRGVWESLIIIISSGTIVLLTYVIVFLLTNDHMFKDEKSIGNFIQWILIYSAHPNWGTTTHFQITSIRQFLVNQINNFIILPENLRFLGKFIKIFFLFFISATVLWNLFATIRRTPCFAYRGFFITIFFVYSIFIIWWLPNLRQLIIPNTIAIVCLTCLFVKDLTLNPFNRRITNPIKFILFLLIAAGCLLIFTSNFKSTIIPKHYERPQAYYEAKKINELVSENCDIMSDWKVGTNLQYYYRRRTIGINKLFLRFYRPEEIPPIKGFLALPDLSNEHCSAVPLHLITPNKTMHRINGFEKPSEWLALFKWLFRIEHCIRLQEITYSNFDLVKIDNNRAYIVFDHSTRDTVEEINELFYLVDEKAQEILDNYNPVFKKWINLNKHQLS